MKIKWGALVTEGRGKLGGHVASKNKSGAILRTKVTPVNPQTSAQASARSRLGGNSQGWANLSEAERRSWIAAASQYAKTNIFGDQYFPSGKNLYTSINNNLVMVDESPLSEAPSFAEMPFIVDMQVTVADGTSTFGVIIDATGSLVGKVLVIEASASLSAGKYNFDGSYRQVAQGANGTSPTPSSMYIFYAEKFGRPTVGKKIGVRAYFIDSLSGNASPRFSATAIVE